MRSMPGIGVDQQLRVGDFWARCQELIEAIITSFSPLRTSVGWVIAFRWA